MKSNFNRWLLAALTIAFGLAVWTAIPRAQSRPQDLALQEGKRSLAVGNLKEAVEQFKAIVAKYPDDRPTVAAALLGLADCYRRQGDAESQKIYEQVIAEFAEQREAVAIARARLAPAETNVEPVRRLWTVPKDGDVVSTVSYDGRYVAYVDWSDAGKGDLFLHGFGGGTDRRLTQSGNKPGTPWKWWADSAAFARDGRSLAFVWIDDERARLELSVVALAGTAAPQPKVIVGLDSPSWIEPFDWTPDGRWIAATWKLKDAGTTIGMVSTMDGSLRDLKTIDRPCSCAARLTLSPDGRYLAYDMPARDTKARDIYVIDVATAVEYPAVVYDAHDTVVGWSPDGQSLIFTSDRLTRGTDSLWTVPFVPGKAGTATPLRSEVGPFESRGMTATGAVFYCRCEAQAGSDIKIAEFDFSTGTFISPPVDAVQQFVGTNSQPFWSPDGKSFLYRTIRPNQDPMIAIQDVATGEVHELRPHQVSLSDPRWAPDGKSFAVLARDFSDSFGYRRIDVATGAVTQIVTYPRGNAIGPMDPVSSWKDDGTALFFRRYELTADPEGVFVEVDVATGREREIVRLKLPRDTLYGQLSPDQKTLYYRRPIPGGALSALVARDMTSGQERELLRRDRLGNFNISPDGRWLGVGVESSTTDPAHVWLVPTGSGEARELYRGPANQSAGGASLVSMGPGVWAPDSQSLILRFSNADATIAPDFWWVPLDNRQPRKLVEFAGLNPAGLRVHPDGHRILFGAKPATPEKPKPTEFWVLEPVVRK